VVAVTEIAAPPAAAMHGAGTPTRALRLAFLAQENMAVPPPVPGGSISRIVHRLALELATSPERFEVAVCSRPHPRLPEGVHDRVRYLRVSADGDARRHATYEQTIRVLRRLDLPHRELQGMPLYSQAYASAGLRRLAELEPDVVVVQNVGRFVPLARRLVPGAHVVLHMHCDWLRQLPRREAGRYVGEADLVLGVSDYITGRVREAFPDYADRCRTLHNGTDARPLTDEDRRRAAELREELGLGDAPVVLYVGTFAVEKGIDVLLEAFRLLLRDLPEARLLLVGAPNRYFQVRAPRGRRTRRDLRRKQRAYPTLVKELAAGLGDRVVMPGAIPHAELPAYYALADVYTMPSTGDEPFTLTIPEAMAAGLPVVATATGGTVEIVEDGVNGLLVPRGDAESLAAAFEQLCRDRARAAALGRSGRLLVEERFTWHAQARQLAAYCEEIAVGRD
jgi:glycosyltransferase involved in cell wall biosynthesis